MREYKQEDFERQLADMEKEIEWTLSRFERFMNKLKSMLGGM